MLGGQEETELNFTPEMSLESDHIPLLLLDSNAFPNPILSPLA